MVKGYVEHAGLVSSAQFAPHEESPGSSAKQTDSQAVGGSGVGSSGGPMRGTEGAASFCTQAAGEQA